MRSICFFRSVTSVLALVGSIILASVSMATVEPPHHKILLNLDPVKGVIEVRDRIEIFGRKEIALRVAEWMSISELRIDGHLATARHANGALMLALPSEGPHRIDFVATGVISKGNSSRVGRGPGAVPEIGLDGIYLPGWANWFPETAEKKISFSLTIKTPSSFRAVATGRLESEALDAKQNTAVFSATQTEGRPSVFAGPYIVSEQSIGGIRIRTYFHRSVERLAAEYIAAAGRYLQFYEQKIGPYPFADFHIISAPLPVGLGFPGLTYIDRRILPLPFIKDRSLAHEVLHNWFGNGIRTDYASGNWSEGLTTYMADHELAARRDPPRAAEMRLGWLRDYAALPTARDIPVARFRHKTHDAAQVVGYGKVALIFHMLRLEVGDNTFDDALRRFWKEFRFRSASWSDLRRVFEMSARTDLGWFFDQWTQRAGAPRLELADAFVKSRGDGFELNLILTQAEPIYRLKVPIEIATATGTVHSYLLSDGARTMGRFRLNAAPVSVRIDPDYALFRRLLPGEAPPILRDVLLDGTARTLLLYKETRHLLLARKLAERMFDTRTPPAYAGSDQLPPTSLLVIGPPQRIDSLMKRLDVSERPVGVAGKGSARAWMARRSNGSAILFIEADGPDDLQALLRPLPHYRSKSYVVLEGGRVVTSGVLPSTGSSLAKQLQ